MTSASYTLASRDPELQAVCSGASALQGPAQLLLCVHFSMEESSLQNLIISVCVTMW